MNRPRLQILADHLRSLPDERFDMRAVAGRDGRWEDSRRPAAEILSECGTAACLSGWAATLFAPDIRGGIDETGPLLGLSWSQTNDLFTPPGFHRSGRYTRTDGIAAIQSMLDSPDDDALPVWPSREGASA